MELSKEIFEKDFKTEDNYTFRFVHYDGVNFTGNTYNGTDTRSYTNGDQYKKTCEKDENHNIVKVTIMYYEKEADLTYYCIKEIDKDVIYKMNDSIITKEEFDNFVNKFMNKNDISIRDFINSLQK